MPEACWPALVYAWHALARAGHMLARVARGRECRSFHWRVGPPMEVIPPWMARLGEQEPDGGVHFLIRCSKEWVLRLVGTTARGGAWNFLAGALTGVWRRV